MDSNCEQNHYCQEKIYWPDVNIADNSIPQLNFTNYQIGPCSTHVLDYKQILNSTADNEMIRYGNCDSPCKKSIVAPPKVFKRRNTANKKERRRTQSINTAFSSLRNKIPNVPLDTKLSKIKTLRLATSYITYLKKVLEGDQDPEKGFQAEIITSPKKHNIERKNNFKNLLQIQVLDDIGIKKIKGRTGWPQDLWASELKHESKP